MEKKRVLEAKPRSRCAVIVAHPGDETLWAGGLLTMHPELKWTLLSLSGGKDPQKTRCFQEAASRYGASGLLGKLPDNEDDRPLASLTIERAIMDVLPMDRFEVIVTHALWGEYTRNLRNEQVGHAIQILHGNQRLLTPLLLCFGYEDQDGQTPPRADTDAEIQVPLSESAWENKLDILRTVYGYTADDWQLRDAPRNEAFWRYRRFATSKAGDDNDE